MKHFYYKTEGSLDSLILIIYFGIKNREFLINLLACFIIHSDRQAVLWKTWETIYLVGYVFSTGNGMKEKVENFSN